MTGATGRDNISGLDHLLIDWFNPDWDLDYETPDALLRAFAVTEAEDAAIVARQIDDLLAAGPEAPEVSLLHLPPSGRDPREGMSTEEWLRHVRDVLSSPLQAPPAG